MDAKRRMKLIQVIQKIDRNSRYAERIGTKNISEFIRENHKDKEGRKS